MSKLIHCRIRARLTNYQHSMILKPANYFSTMSPNGATDNHTHFRVSPVPHPLMTKPLNQLQGTIPMSDKDVAWGDHTGRQQNHIWSKEEIEGKMSTLYKHKPATVMDHMMHKLVRSCVSSVCQ